LNDGDLIEISSQKHKSLISLCHQLKNDKFGIRFRRSMINTRFEFLFVSRYLFLGPQISALLEGLNLLDIEGLDSFLSSKSIVVVNENISLEDIFDLGCDYSLL
jgi:hypothetical protein